MLCMCDGDIDKYLDIQIHRQIGKISKREEVWVDLGKIVGGRGKGE